MLMCFLVYAYIKIQVMNFPKITSYVALASIIASSFSAEQTLATPVPSALEQLINDRQIIGKVTIQGSNDPASFATVALLKTDSTLVDGSIADEEGVFSISNINPGNYLLKITLVGYETLVYPNVNVATESKLIDLKILTIKPESQMLQELVIRGEKSMIVSDIDKKIVNVGKDLLSTSNNASEILEKIPAVSLDENGSPQIRGKGNIIVLIDGKPSTLYGNDVATVLQSFPSELIEKVEVITTPSAKYEGDGVSGVIDIITKKSKITGVSGNVRGTLGSDNNNNLSGYLNIKRGKWSYNASGNAGRVYHSYKRSMQRDNLLGDAPTILHQNGLGNNQSTNYFGRAGIAFDPNDKNSFTVGINYSNNAHRNYSLNDNETVTLLDSLINSFSRLSLSNSGSHNLSTNFDYKHTFKEKHILTFNGNYSSGANDGHSDFEQKSDWVNFQLLQNNLRKGNNNSIFLNLDYQWPISQNSTLETGIRTRQGESKSTNSFFNFDPETGAYEFNEKASNDFGYKDALYTGFVTFTQKSDNWGIRGGLRVTNVTQDINQISANQAFSVNFTTLVPSLALTRKLTEEKQVKLNYSRRAQRPNAGQLNPFTDISDPRNIRTGNPNLKPEFIHKAELGYSHYSDHGGWGPSLFVDYSNNAITQVRSIDEEGISYTQFDNVGREAAYGFETDYSTKIGERIKVNASGRIFRTEVVSPLANIDNKNWSYSGNVNAFFDLPFKMRASTFLNYEGPRSVAQGTRRGVFVANIGLRRDLLNRKATISANLQDIFLSRIYGSNLSTKTYIQSSKWQRTNRFLGVTFMYRFGKITAQAEEA